MKLFIGIDSGINTGFAIWNPKEQHFEDIRTITILEAFDLIDALKEKFQLIIYVEDARQVVNFDPQKAQGAGSVKRDCIIWEEFLQKRKLIHYFVRPNKRITKICSENFQQMTNYKGKTNEHGRDAAMLVFNKQ